jgi:hypothetical protein
MLSKLLGSSVVVIGLLLAGPQEASAQVINACVNSTTGLLFVVAANANCPPASSGATWTKISWSTGTTSGTPGLPAGADFQCAPQTPVSHQLLQFSSQSQGPLSLNPGSPLSFGTAIGVGSSPFTNVLLQPGFYQVHLSGHFPSALAFGISAALNNPPTFDIVATWNSANAQATNPDPAVQPLFDLVGGDRFISVGQPNITLSLAPFTFAAQGTGSFCELVITKLQ